MQSHFRRKYENTKEYRLYIETLTPYQKYLFDNDTTEYISDPRIYFNKMYTYREADYLSVYGVYSFLLNDIEDNFCINKPFNKIPSQFKYIKSNFDYLELLYGPSYKPDLSMLVRDEELVQKAKLYWEVKILMDERRWEELKTKLESNLNLVDSHFIRQYFSRFWYNLEFEDITPLDIAIRAGFDIDNKVDAKEEDCCPRGTINLRGTLLSWIFGSCSDSYRYNNSFTKSEKYILNLIQYCFEKGATHPKYIMYNYDLFMSFMDEGPIKDLFKNYENQIESKFDFTKYELLKSDKKQTVKNLLLSCQNHRGGEGELRPSIIGDVMSMFSVKIFI